LTLSRGTAVILLVLYGLCLYFQLNTQAKLFETTQEESDKKEREAETAKPSTPKVAVTLMGVFVSIAICGENMVDFVDEFVEALHINKAFISLILLPLLVNVAEYISAIHAAYKGKIDLSIEVVVGSSLQISPFVIPTLVVIG
jgi:Ca2+:H+ antiporter